MTDTAPPPDDRAEEVDEQPFHPEPPAAPAAPIGDAQITFLENRLKTVYFAYDQHDLSDDTRRILRENAEALRTYADPGIVIQGHCDERGTIEYNLALGERRAGAVRQYLASLGVNASRIRIVSYGEEKPAKQGNSEAAWSRNRRAQFDVE